MAAEITADIPNREGHEGFDVVWPWQEGPLKPGLTCVFRVRNEARNLPWVLPPMLEAVQHVVLVDNMSDDGTGEVALEVARSVGAEDRFTLATYPFNVSRAGAEHLRTPADSVHSLTHFYNWSFSHVKTAYSMKWDGDMVLTREGVAALSDLSWQLENSQAVVAVPRHPLTVVNESEAWIDLGMKFLEPWVYPMGPEFTFVKAFEWEVREFPETSERIVLNDGLCVELKWLDQDEFAHWTDTDFGKARAPRKQREWEVDQAIREGRANAVPGLVRIVAPPGVHVVDHVTDTWLPEAERPLVRRGRGAGGISRSAAESVQATQAAAASAVKAADQAAADADDDGDDDDDTPAQRGQGGGRREAKIKDLPGGTGELTDAILARSPHVERLRQFVRNSPAPALVMLHPDLEYLRPIFPEACDLLVLPAHEVPEGGRWGMIMLVAPDRDALRRTCPALPPTRGSQRIALWLDESDRAITLDPRSDWPVMTHLHARRISRTAALTMAIFGDPVSGHAALAEIARQSVPHDVGNRGLRVAVHGDAIAPPGDVNAVRIDEVLSAADPERDVPPDVVLTDGPRDIVLPEHPVLGRAPVVVDDTSGPLALGPLDERILNPIGFGPVEDDATNATLGVQEDGATSLVIDGQPHRVELGRGATEALVRSLRPARGVELTWPETEDRGLARAVAGLAMTGVPLVSATVPTWATDLLGPAVSAAITAEVDLADRLAREEHSIVQRRAALREFASFGWRSRIGAAVGVRVASQPSVSVVLATKRPDRLDFALRQVARQRGLDGLELILAPHGFDVDEAHARKILGEDKQLTLLPQSADTMFGDVLAAATNAASGDVVLKMDDDDWYGPDLVADLLLARTYSGADLVGTPAEFVYLEPRDLTIRRNDPSEMYAKFVAGGTMMMEKGTLRSLGGFRQVRKYVDATLLSDVLGAGLSLYRTQGLGYVFRRGDSGHTWEASVDFFLDPDRIQAKWDGLRPSRLLELDPADL
ncbi:glycosyltransferase [Nocardioides sp. LS1]|uniref:glycosyltransferase n=1 Tax=Nocardioides sp. LS1 TaxID=1027620 RepID=UPI000FFA29CF|nr:hypothetical protein [Nocardioides sp. LS1]GCD90330.1 hypothetical protein NLS1_23360 [Nocardioides sp. LS1]